MSPVILSKCVVNLDNVSTMTWSQDNTIVVVQFVNAPGREFKGDDAAAIWKACEDLANHSETEKRIAGFAG